MASTGSRPEGDASGVPRYTRDGSMMQVGLKALRHRRSPIRGKKWGRAGRAAASFELFKL